VANSEQHKKRMRERRERQLARQPGFTPVANKRIDGAIMAAMLAFQMHGLNASEAHERARRQVASGLPKARPFRHLFPRPSKNDSAAYRKQVA
jgi:hypothetical protein